MSKRFQLPPQQVKKQCPPVWIPVLVGIVIGLGLGLLLNMLGIMRCCDYSDAQPMQEKAVATQVAQRELLGSSPLTEKITDETVQTDEEIDSALETQQEEAATEATATAPVEPQERVKQIRLQVLNGCGEKGIARNVAPALRKLGFDVRESGNAKNFRHQQTKIYDRSGNMALAYEVAQAVGIDSSLVAELIDQSLVDIDVTIVIGADYRALNLGMKE